MCRQACPPVCTSSLTLACCPHREEAARKGATTGRGGQDGDDSCLSLSRRPSRSALPSRHPTRSPSARLPRPPPPITFLTHLSAHLTWPAAMRPRPPTHPTFPPARASYTNPAPQRTGLAVSWTCPPPSPCWLHPHRLPASLSTIIIHVTSPHMPARFLHAPPTSGTLAPLTYPSFPTWPAHPLTCPAPSPMRQWMGRTRRSHSLPACPTHVQRMPSCLTRTMDVSGPPSPGTMPPSMDGQPTPIYLSPPFATTAGPTTCPSCPLTPNAGLQTYTPTCLTDPGLQDRTNVSGTRDASGTPR